MTGRRNEGRKAFQVMQGQIALLQKGSRATLYACRELLGLNWDCDWLAVQASLYARLHLLNREGGENVQERLLGYVTAAHLLLKAFAEA